jgi:DNA-binding MarR family transcriptional regulator
MKDRTEKRRKSVDFSLKASWLSISKLYNMLGAPYGLTHSNGFVLLNIDRDHGTPATKIAPSLGMEARSLTRMLKTLEEEGWICREGDDSDKRKVIIKLTEIGREKRDLSRMTVKYFQHKVSQSISDAELQAFYQTIEKIQAVVDDLMEHPPKAEDYEREIAGAQMALSGHAKR